MTCAAVVLFTVLAWRSFGSIPIILPCRESKGREGCLLMLSRQIQQSDLASVNQEQV